ncbi:ABC transporter substrate-binding protein [Corynebacterium choanae]|uniref:Corrinoid ABC transporter substrate-binding protein n=1 Tax=Corynebacterium choanae TaxID=1862358 RepID=A0A3G6J4P4_9CORY|nr:ABC transporter substrate-binding protein [Corynebacterium choanae]AZA12703.1 corrinoid ABC transporter substrate-binding protein [Corynebacterium choanae]
MSLSLLRRTTAVLAGAGLALAGCSGAEESTSSASSTSSTSSSVSATSTTTSQSSEGITVTDIVGRTVTLDKLPERIILGEGRGVFATGILDKTDPLEHIVAIGSDLKANVPDYYTHFVNQFPEVESLPEIGHIAKGDVTVENLVSLNPDVILFTKDQYDAAQTTGLDKQIDDAGLTYIVTDFRQHPLENTTRSMEIFGAVFGHENEAAAFNKEWQQTVDSIKAKATPDGKSVFVWRAAGVSDCCGTWNNSNISELVNAAGGKNIGDSILDGESGAVTPEKVIEQNPEVIIATGGDWSAKKDKEGNPVGYIALGYDISADQAQASVNAGPDLQPGFDTLQAVQTGDFHAMWHQFYNSPFNYVALLQIAKWVNPEAFADIDVAAAWKASQDTYSPVSAAGTFFSTAEAK